MSAALASKLEAQSFLYDCVIIKNYGLSGRQFIDVVEQIADEASAVAARTSEIYRRSKAQAGELDFRGQVRLFNQMETAQRYQRLANDMEYIRATRTPFLSLNAKINLFIEETAYDSFVRLMKGQSYSLDTLSYGKEWFDNLAYATRHHVPKQTIRNAAKKFEKEKLNHVLRNQVADDFKKEETAILMKKSPFGACILKQMELFDYECRFIDLQPYSNVDIDMGTNGVAGVCYSKNFMYVDATLSKITGAIKWAHEIGHAFQFWEDENTQQKKDSVNKAGSEFSSTKEAHSIAFEFILAGELLAAGVDCDQIHKSLKDIPAKTINHLIDDPAKFIMAVSQSSVMRKCWGFTPKEKKKSPELAVRYAKSVRALCARWEDLPQPVKETAELSSLFKLIPVEMELDLEKLIREEPHTIVVPRAALP